MAFKIGQEYSREDVREELGLVRTFGGGIWSTGVVSHDGGFFIFAGVGVPGRTGHDYDNGWVGEHFRWYHKTRSRLDWPSVQELLRPGSSIHLFSRSTNLGPFEYHGYAIPVEVIEDSSPVEVIFMLTNLPPDVEDFGVSSLQVTSTYEEGNSRRVEATVYERDPKARQRCIDHYGPVCVVCKLNFENRYGDLGKGYIQVHHLVPISKWGEKYSVDPIRDLCPICANCHAMVHRRNPPYSVEYVRAILATQNALDRGQESSTAGH